MTEGESDGKPVQVARVEVLRGHMACTVRFAAGVPRVTSPQLMALILPQFPNLPRHACVNERGETFAAVMDRTPLPHLLEHMIVDLQVCEMAKAGDASGGDDAVGAVSERKGLAPRDPRASRARTASSNASIVGTSEWLDESAGIARIDVSFTDDHAALRALCDAVAALNSLFSS